MINSAWELVSFKQRSSIAHIFSIKFKEPILPVSELTLMLGFINELQELPLIFNPLTVSSVNLGWKVLEFVTFSMYLTWTISFFHLMADWTCSSESPSSLVLISLKIEKYFFSKSYFVDCKLFKILKLNIKSL